MLGAAAVVATGLVVAGGIRNYRSKGSRKPDFEIALAQYSLHRRIGKLDGADPLDPLDFAAVARSFGISAIEYVSMLWRDVYRAKGDAYIKEMRKRADDHGVRGRLLMIDREGALGDADPAKRNEALDNHARWLDVAAELECYSIRVDPKAGGSDYQESLKLMADGLYRLCERAQNYKLNVLVENEAGFGADADWLLDLIRRVDHPLAGLLPDFGNFWIDEAKGTLYDPYEGVQKMMPRARAISAKSYGFTSSAPNITRDTRPGRELELDYGKLIPLVVGAGYKGYIAIEYEGPGPEMEGIAQTKRVLERLAMRA